MPSSPPPARDRSWTQGPSGDVPLLRASFGDQRFPRHTHDRFVVGVDVCGAHRTWYRGGRHTVPTAVLAVVNPGEVHTGSRVAGSPWHYRAVYPAVATMREVAAERSERRTDRVPWFPELIIRDTALAHEFVAAHRILDRGVAPFEGESRMLCVLGALAGRYSELRSPDAGSTLDTDRVTRVKDFLLSNLRKRHRLEELARIAGLSRYHLLRVFKRETGIPPYAFLSQARIARAKKLLSGGTAIARTALEVGFFDQSHFTNRFRRYVGVTPGEYVRGLSRD